jgi:hypothetical protein
MGHFICKLNSIKYIHVIKLKYMKQFIISLLVSLTTLYLVISFISLTPNIVEWEASGRGVYILFVTIFGIVGHTIYFETRK